MKAQFRVLQVPSGAAVGGVTATLRDINSGAALATAITDTDGFVSFTLNGTPPPCQVQITKAGETRLLSSQPTGPAGAFDVSEMQRVLQAVGGASGGVSAISGSGLDVTTTGAANRSVTVGTGTAVTPEGFLFVAYTTTVLAVPAPTSPATNATFYVVVDGSSAAVSLGQTQLKVVESVAANQTKLAEVVSRSSSEVIAAADINNAGRPLLLQGIRTTQGALATSTALASPVTLTSEFVFINLSTLQTSLTLPSGTWDVTASVIASTNGEVELAPWAGTAPNQGAVVASGTGVSQVGGVLIETGVAGGSARSYGAKARRRSGGLAGDYTLTRGTVYTNPTVPLNYPYDVAKASYVYISNGDSAHVQIWNGSGTAYIGKFGKNGTANGEFRFPIGITTDNTFVWVVDSGNNRVQRLSISGSTLSYSGKFGSSGTGTGDFSSAQAIAYGGGFLYVTDLGRDKILRFNTSGVFQNEWGGYGSATTQFNEPYGVAVDGSGNVLVADLVNDRISKFTSTGTFISSFATSNPRNVEVDAAGNIWVTSSADDTVRVYSSGGTLLATSTWASYPNGMVVNGSNMLVVNGSTTGFANGGAIASFSVTGDYEVNAATLSVTAVPRR
jgi:hypothetical protein